MSNSYNKVYYIDTFSTNNMHEMYNASSLLMFSKIYDKVEYRSAYSSFINVQKLLKEFPNNIFYKRIFLPSLRKNSYGRFIMQIIAIITNIFYIIKCNDCLVFINYNTAISLYPINLICKIFHRDVLICCHGELQDIENKRKTSWLFKQSIRFFIRPQTNIAQGLNFCVLSKSIYETIKNVMPYKISMRFTYFEHTAIFNTIPCKKTEPSQNKLIVGMSGGLRESKGLSNFIELAKRFKDNNSIEFRLIGRIQNSDKLKKEYGIVCPFGDRTSFIPREDMYYEIKKLHYGIFLFPADGYRYTASGSIFDMIDCETSIISLYNDYFNHLFSQYGKFGYLVNSLDEMENLINQIINTSKQNKMIKPNFEIIKADLSPQNEALNLKKRILKI